MVNYQYDTLPKGRCFRLLHIHPGAGNDPLTCDLITVDLDINPSYKALSYVWGDATALAEIKCCGLRVSVTVSLLEGLRRLRTPDQVQVAWADAICINQSDIEEKTHQVNLMGHIYDKAAEVIVWLGKDTDDLADVAFEALKAANAAVNSGTSVVESTVPDAFFTLESEDGQKSAPYQYYQRSSRLPDILQPRHLHGIKEFYQLPWFSRVWVLQEVGLASEAKAFWGDSSIDFSEIALFILHAMIDKDMDDALGQDIKDVISGPPYYAFWNVWLTYHKETSWVSRCPPLKRYSEYQAAECQIDFLLVLEASRRFNATNDLDHVFAFLGHPKALDPATNKLLVQADYNLTMEDLNVTIASRLAQQSLNLLTQVQHQSEILEGSCAVPSWIPKWSVHHSDAPSAFWEAWDSSLRTTTRPRFSARPSELKLYVSALLFDTVSLHTDTMTKSDFDRSADGPGDLVEKCWKLTEEAAKTAPHAYDEKGLLSFIHTLICYHKAKTVNLFEDRELLTVFTRFCALYNGKFWEEKLQRYDAYIGGAAFLSERRFLVQFQEYATNRRFFVSHQGYWGLGPSLMQKGDVCAIIFGADVPFILRPTDAPGEYRLVGQAYICGAMYGEIVHKLERGETTCAKEDICLI